jgi:uncharacterized protein YkwD
MRSALSIACLSFATLAASAAWAGDAPCYKGDPKICRIEARIADLTNGHRHDQGLSPLAFDPQMSFVARDWSSQQAAAGDISHAGFPDDRSSVYVREFGALGGIFIAGENVAMNGGMSTDEEQVAAQLTEQWWESDGHRANMLGEYDGIGVGVAITGDGSVYGTQDFYQKR